MRVWLPYIIGGSGTDTFTRAFATELESQGHMAAVQSFPHWMQYAPHLLKRVGAPPGTDVVLTNTWNGFAFRRSGFPMVTMEQLCVHDPEFAPFRSTAQATFHNTLVRRYETRTFSAADHVVAVSEGTRSVVERAFPGVTPSVIPNGVDTEFFVPPEQPRVRHVPDPFRLLFVGNLTRRKGADLLAPLMRALGSNFTLRYTSGLREGPTLELSNAHGLGILDSEAVRREYQEADALIFPTRLEGLPLVVLEAMACGLPVIGSNMSSMPEAVDDGVTGILSALEIADLEQAVRSLAVDESRRVVMARAARHRAVELFSMRETVKRYLVVFELAGAR